MCEYSFGHIVIDASSITLTSPRLSTRQTQGENKNTLIHAKEQHSEAIPLYSLALITLTQRSNLKSPDSRHLTFNCPHISFTAGFSFKKKNYKSLIATSISISCQSIKRARSKRSLSPETLTLSLSRATKEVTITDLSFI